MTTTNVRQLSKLSRQEMHDLIWSTPAIKLATEFGVSDVAIAKRCKRLNVPRPSRGYWAKLAAGQKPKRTLLPPSGDEVFAREAHKRVGKSLALPDEITSLHPLASELIRELNKAKLDSHKRATLRDVSTLPEVTVSKSLAERVGKAFHVILNGVEPVGIPFRKSQSCYDGGYFKKGPDRFYLYIEEDLVDSTGTRLQVPTWQSQPKQCVRSGFLTFSFKAEHYGPHNAGRWSETAKVSLEKVLAEVVSAIRKHYVEIQVRRTQEEIERAKKQAEWEEQQRKWEAQEVIRVQKEKERKHAEALATIVKARRQNLLRAAELWRASRNLLEFLAECERQWKQTSNELNPEQAAWLSWAKAQANALSPFSLG